MRNKKRIPVVLGEIEKIWEKYPDLRLGQLLVNACGEFLFYAEDDKVVMALSKMLDEPIDEKTIKEMQSF